MFHEAKHKINNQTQWPQSHSDNTILGLQYSSILHTFEISMRFLNLAQIENKTKQILYGKKNWRTVKFTEQWLRKEMPINWQNDM